MKKPLLTFEEWTGAAEILLSSLGMPGEKLFDVHESSALQTALDLRC